MNTLPETIKVKFDELLGAIHHEADDLKIAGAEANLNGDFTQVAGIIDNCLLLQELEINIKSVLKSVVGKHKTQKRANPKTSNNQAQESERIFSNKEIQAKISQAARMLPDEELEQLCDKNVSKRLFDCDLPLFKKCPTKISAVSKHEVIKDQHGHNRWTWKFEFERNNFLYAITTQWYARNDMKVKEWLDKHKS
jgi:hypothetical protein